MNYLKIYESIIAQYKHANLPKGVSVENHHIVPRSEGGPDTPDNLVYLPVRVHVFVHELLYVHYKRTEYGSPRYNSAACALMWFFNYSGKGKCHRYFFRSRLAAAVRETWNEYNKTALYITNGKQTTRKLPDEPMPEGWYYGMTKHSDERWITNGKEQTRIQKSDPIPAGWYIGCMHKPTKDTLWINDGKSECLLQPDGIIPEGWVYGRIARIWITNGRKNRRILVNTEIPVGWKLGRVRFAKWNNPVEKHEFRGEYLTLKQIAKKIGIRYNALTYRIRQGETFEQIAAYPEKHPANILYQGQMYRKSDLARLLNMNESALGKRLRKGMSVEEILAVYKHRK